MTLKKLKVCFVGIGSIAKRHIKNLTRISFEDGINLSIDAVRRNGNKENDDIYNSLKTFILCTLLQVSINNLICFIIHFNFTIVYPNSPIT